ALGGQNLVAPADTLAGAPGDPAGRRVGRMERLHLAAGGARAPEELEVARGRDVTLESLHARVKGLLPLPLVEAIRGQHAQAHLGEHAERPQRYARALEELGAARGVTLDDLAFGVDEPETCHLCRDAAEAPPGAVGARGHRPGDALAVDVAHVHHRKALSAEPRAELLNGAARPHRGEPGDGIGG